MTSPTLLNLNGTWRLACVPAKALSFRGDDRAAVRDWLPATVPGNVHADLMRAGQLPDLYVADHIRHAAWVDQWDWWLEREVTLELGQRALLHFDGIDYYATIWLDDHLLGCHEGAFSRHSIELTAHYPSLAPKHSFRLAVRLWGASKWPLPAWRWWERLLAPLTRLILPGKASLRPYHPRLRLLRAPMQAGWDFAPQLAAIGLWEGVYIEMGQLRIEGLRFIPSPQMTIVQLQEQKEASGVVTFKLDMPNALDVDIYLRWQPDNFEGQGEQLTLKQSRGAGKHEFCIPITISEPRYWYPWEQGKPNLYQLTVIVDLHNRSSSSASSASLRFGLRTIESHQMRLKVNGQPFFARAINWVPSDILLGTVKRERYEQLLGLAVDAGVNLVRVWGGGGRERREFYEVCDELGLLIWQEFPFACAFLDHYPRDEHFLSLVEQEASAMVRELRHHASLALWGAGNEFSYWRNRPLVKRLASIVAREDTRPFLRPSPSHHDRHNWHVWHGKAPLHLFAKETTTFLSEFGLQALPEPATLSRFLAPTGDSSSEESASLASLWPPNPLWQRHHADLERLRLYVPNDAQTSLERFSEASQRAQAQGIQLAIEQMRRRKAVGAAGVALWQWNEPWPAISWALVDYYGKPKIAAKRLHQWYAPLLLSLEWPASHFQREPTSPLEATLWAINDLASDYSGCEARLMQDNQCLWSNFLSLPAHSARVISKLRLTLPDSSPLRLELWQSGTLLTSNHYELHLLGPQQGSLLSHLYRTLAEWIMRW